MSKKAKEEVDDEQETQRLAPLNTFINKFDHGQSESREEMVQIFLLAWEMKGGGDGEKNEENFKQEVHAIIFTWNGIKCFLEYQK